MRSLLAFLLISSLALAQAGKSPSPQRTSPPSGSAAQTAPSAPAKTAPAAESVAPSAPVITIDGFCAKQASTPASTPAADCKTVVTRSQFEKLANAINPDMPEAQKRQLANIYAQALVVSTIAEERGLANKPATAEVLRFARMQALGSMLIRDLQEEAAKVPQADIEKYYNEHKNQYEEGSLQRVFIPKSPAEPGKPPDEAKLKAEADKIHAAAVAGGDMEKLQKQAYDDLGLKSTPPPVSANDVRREALPPGQVKVFDLQPGQVSDVLDEPGGLYVYKMVSKKSLTLAEAGPEIKRTIEQERMQQEMDKIRKNLKPEYNEAYFGSGGSPEGRPPMMPPGAHPQATPPPAPPKK